MEDITDVDYAHAKRVCKDLEIKNIGKYHDLYVQSEVMHYCQLMYLRTFNICVVKYMNLILQNFFLQNFLIQEISMVSSFKKDKSKIRSFN